MIPIFEFQKRSNDGPLTESNDFDVMLSRKARELVKKYDLKLDPDNIIPDDDTADAVFAAAVEFLSEVGVYHIETQRIIKWDKEEVLETAAYYKNNPQIFTMGKNKDCITMKPRNSKDSFPPVFWGGANPFANQNDVVPVIQAFAQEEDVQGFGVAGHIAEVDEIKAVKGTPGEVYCALWEADAQKEALTRAGRPDMLRGLVPTATSLGAILASMGPGRLEPHNMFVAISIMPEQRIDWDILNTAYTCERLGIIPWIAANSMVGGLCGGPEGAAMGAVASLLAQLSYGHGKWGAFSIPDMTGSWASKQCLAALSAAHRATERNIDIPTMAACTDVAKPMTCYEQGIIAGTMIALTINASGAGITWLGGTTPLTCRIHADIMRNVAGMDSNKVNVILQNLSKKTDDLVAQYGEANLTFFEQLCPAVYDLETLKPKKEYLEAVKNSLDIMSECGVPISNSLILD